MKTIYRFKCPSFTIEVLAASFSEAAKYVEQNHGNITEGYELKGKALDIALDGKVYFEA